MCYVRFASAVQCGCNLYTRQTRIGLISVRRATTNTTHVRNDTPQLLRYSNVSTCVSLCAGMCVHMYHMCVCVHVCMCICMYLCNCVRMRIFHEANNANEYMQRNALVKVWRNGISNAPEPYGHTQGTNCHEDLHDEGVADNGEPCSL